MGACQRLVRKAKAKPASGSTQSRPPVMPPWVKHRSARGQPRCGLRQPSAWCTSRATAVLGDVRHALDVVAGHLVDGGLREHARPGPASGSAGSSARPRRSRSGTVPNRPPPGQLRRGQEPQQHLLHQPVVDAEAVHRHDPRAQRPCVEGRVGHAQRVRSGAAPAPRRRRCSREARHGLGQQDEGDRVVGVARCPARPTGAARGTNSERAPVGRPLAAQ